MTDNPEIPLQERILALEEALAEYARFYGLTPKARHLFTLRPIEEIGRNRDAPVGQHVAPARRLEPDASCPA